MKPRCNLTDIFLELKMLSFIGFINFSSAPSPGISDSNVNLFYPIMSKGKEGFLK